MSSQYFEKKINDRNYCFSRTVLNGEIIYHIHIAEKGKLDTFKMKKDDSDLWTLQSRILPDGVLKSSLQLNDAIEDNIKGIR